jgi:hypothetical protein
MKIDLEFVLAALIEQADGALTLGTKYLLEDYGGKVIAMTYAPDGSQLLLELLDEDEVTYDDK